MAYKSFNQRFPTFKWVLLLAIIISVPLTVWSLNNVSTNYQQDAAKGGNSGGSGSGSCEVMPNPVSVGADWTVAGTGLPSSAFVNILESDSVGTTAWFLQTSPTRTLSQTWHSYNVGKSTIQITTAAAHRKITLATCYFQVQ